MRAAGETDRPQDTAAASTRNNARTYEILFIICRSLLEKIVAEREGFEPSVGVYPLHSLSRRAPSAVLGHLSAFIYVILTGIDLPVIRASGALYQNPKAIIDIL